MAALGNGGVKGDWGRITEGFQTSFHKSHIATVQFGRRVVIEAEYFGRRVDWGGSNDTIYRSTAIIHPSTCPSIHSTNIDWTPTELQAQF